MISQKSILTFSLLFVIIYMLLILPFTNLNETYTDFYQKQATWLFTNFGSDGYILFDHKEDDNNNQMLTIKQTNKSLVDEHGNVESIVYDINTKNLAYLPIALMIALFLATPLKLVRKLLLLFYGLLLLHLFLMASLYIIIIHSYTHHPSLKMFQLSQAGNNFVDFINGIVENGTGLNSFLVILIWISMLLFFEKGKMKKIIGLPLLKNNNSMPMMR